MKIGMVAPVWERVPPVAYGGIELVVNLLTEELVRRGHDVTLFASGESLTKAKLSSVYPEAVREGMGRTEIDLHHVATAFHRAGEFDVMHNHTGYTGIACASFVDTPCLTTLHGIFTEQNTPFFIAFGHAVYYNSISNEQRRPCPDINYIATVYNAIDIDAYEFSAEKKDYFVSIGRVSPLKGTHLACKVAQKAGVKLLLAGKVDPGGDTDYFEHQVKPYIDGEQIQWLGEVTEEEKVRLYREARAFIFPLQWSEPFGLVMAEAMVCGTPVIAFPYGSVPEVVIDGKTGFLVNNVDEMVDAVKRIDEIDPHACRRHVEEEYSIAKMTDQYEDLYRQIMEKGKPKP